MFNLALCSTETRLQDLFHNFETLFDKKWDNSTLYRSSWIFFIGLLG